MPSHTQEWGWRLFEVKGVGSMTVFSFWKELSWRWPAGGDPGQAEPSGCGCWADTLREVGGAEGGWQPGRRAPFLRSCSEEHRPEGLSAPPPCSTLIGHCVVSGKLPPFLGLLPCRQSGAGTGGPSEGCCED